MKRKIATLGETDITVHPAAGILLLLGLLTRWRALLICTYASIILHETAHAAVSALWHHPPQEVEITPLGAMMRLEDEERMPLTARISVILAGPLMTLILCALSLWLTQNGVIPRETGRLIFLGNAGILLVNLLPALPLDGGRLLSAVLLRLLRRETCWRVMRIIGTAAALGMFYAGKRVAVIGGGDTAIEDSLYLSARSHVTLIHRRTQLRATGRAVERAKANPNINSVWVHRPSALKRAAQDWP